MGQNNTPGTFGMTFQMAQPSLSSLLPLDAPQAGLFAKALSSSTSTANEAVYALTWIARDDNYSRHHTVLRKVKIFLDGLLGWPARPNMCYTVRNI